MQMKGRGKAVSGAPHYYAKAFLVQAVFCDICICQIMLW